MPNEGLTIERVQEVFGQFPPIIGRMRTDARTPTTTGDYPSRLAEKLYIGSERRFPEMLRVALERDKTSDEWPLILMGTTMATSHVIPEMGGVYRSKSRGAQFVPESFVNFAEVILTSNRISLLRDGISQTDLIVLKGMALRTTSNSPVELAYGNAHYLTVQVADAIVAGNQGSLYGEERFNAFLQTQPAEISNQITNLYMRDIFIVGLTSANAIREYVYPELASSYIELLRAAEAEIAEQYAHKESESP